MDSVRQLYLNLKTVRSRFGIWCCDLSELGDEENIATRLGAEAIDLSQSYKQSLDPSSTFLSLNEDKLIDLISTISDQMGKTKVLIYNVDLLLSKLEPNQISNFWNMLLGGLVYKKRALVFMVPKTASQIIPQNEDIKNWVNNQRIIHNY